MIISKRTYRERRRDYYDKLRLVQSIGVAVLLGLLWWKSSAATEAQLRDQVTFVLQIFDPILHYIYLGNMCVISGWISQINSLIILGWSAFLHLHILDIFITIWSSICFSL